MYMADSVSYKMSAIFVQAQTGNWQIAGWEISARPLANASENLVGWVENRPGQVEFCIGYIRHCPVQASAKKF